MLEPSSFPKINLNDPELLQQINKRLTLNLLIQGAAAHIYTTGSHLVKDDLEEISPGLTEDYDRLAISVQLNYSIGDNALFLGWPNRWWGYSSKPQKAFRDHPFLARYGNQLASESTRYLKRRAKAKGISATPIIQSWQLLSMLMALLHREEGWESQLEKIAKRAVSDMWDIPVGRLDACLTQDNAFGNLQQPRSFFGRLMRKGVVGYGGVERRGESFSVVAKAWVFPVLLHELVKGTVELICLHGLGCLNDDVYEAVTDEADQLEYEVWLLQAGPEIWRKFIAAAPRQIPLSRSVMHLARLDPQQLEKLMFLIVEEPNRATDQLIALDK
ncbi:MAG: hypothetical protein ACI9G1_001489 [Pirellulaceae bacterium]|jgi:hypothetical protein